MQYESDSGVILVKYSIGIINLSSIKNKIFDIITFIVFEKYRDIL